MHEPYLCKESVDDKIEEATEDFVPDEDGNVEVSDDNGAVVFEAVVPNSGGSQHEPNHVQTERESEEFSDMKIVI